MAGRGTFRWVKASFNDASTGPTEVPLPCTGRPLGTTFQVLPGTGRLSGTTCQVLPGTGRVSGATCQGRIRQGDMMYAHVACSQG